MLLFVASESIADESRWTLTRPIQTFNRYYLASPDNPANANNPDPCVPKNPNILENIKTYHNLAGVPCGGGYNALSSGWFDYDFTTPRTGWYELIIDKAATDVEFIIDPELHINGKGGMYFYGSSGATTQNDKISNVWLTSGRHTLRTQRFIWYGFPAIGSFTLRASTPALAQSVRASLSTSRTIYRANGCEPLSIYSGQQTLEQNFVVRIKDAATGNIRKSWKVTVPSSKNFLEQRFPLFCSQEGNYLIDFAYENGRQISKSDMREIAYEVIDTSPRPYNNAGYKKILIQEIDSAKTMPDYDGGGQTRVIDKGAGPYRESGDTDWKIYQHANNKLRKFLPEPSWFAYKLNVAIPQQPYMVEVDYPDDAERTFAIALRESAPLSYPVAGGIDSGGEFSLTNKILTYTLIYWPRSRETRISFLTARSGLRAAAAKIRLYRLEGDLPRLNVSDEKTRSFVDWYEEGENFSSIYGAPDRTVNGQRIAFERWVSAFAYMGGNVVSPSVLVYGAALYPSKYNLAFSVPPTNDVLRRMLLICEKYGMKLLPELHPRADELSWPYLRSADPKANLLVSKDGKTLKNTPHHYNPIYPANQDWYVNMIGELVDNYKDSPALLGVNLRLMQWQNPTLNNFDSLSWGYDDYTTGLFQRETGIAIPVKADDPGRFGKRYDWLMTNAKERWISWRCEKIAKLYERIVDRVRRARPDLKVYSSAFSADYGSAWLREAGIDPNLLSRIDGLVMVNALTGYGRVFDPTQNQTLRDGLLDPNALKLFIKGKENGKFLSSSFYAEATDAVLPPESLGWPSTTRKTWMSAVISPAGRHFLEHYAIQLAETDASWLGDGGNGYTLGQPYLREFLQEYRHLPPVPFHPRPDARDPVAVWELQRSVDYLFYAVNRESYTVSVQIQLQGSGSVYRLSTRKLVAAENHIIRFDLFPYQLMTFRATTGVHIVKIATTVPKPELARITTQIHWLEGIDNEIENQRIIQVLNREQRHELREITHEAKAALDRGWVWRARTLIENHRMLPIYRSIGRMPPNLRFTQDDN